MPLSKKGVVDGLAGLNSISPGPASEAPIGLRVDLNLRRLAVRIDSLKNLKPKLKVPAISRAAGNNLVAVATTKCKQQARRSKMSSVVVAGNS